MPRLFLQLVVMPFAAMIGTASFGQENDLPPPQRKVTLNLTVDRPLENETVKLKIKSGDVLAEAPRRQRLEYEVVISGPHDNISVYFDVPKGSKVYSSYQENHKENPQQVLSTLKETICDPVVRIVAVRELRYADHFRGKYYRGRLVFHDPWRPFFEVFLPDAVGSSPVLVPVPREDVETYLRMEGLQENVVPYQRIAQLVHLSGPR